MTYTIKHQQTLTKILWLDVAMGGSTAILGLFFTAFFSTLFGLTPNFVSIVAAVTLAYALMALYLAVQKTTPVKPLRLLVAANWFWAAVSVGLFIIHCSHATLLGNAFLIAQIIVVGGLAYLEGAQLVRKR